MAGDSNKDHHRARHQNDSETSLNSRKKVVEKDSFIKTLLTLYTGNVEERKKIVFRL
jgi:hypothetical protein